MDNRCSPAETNNLSGISCSFNKSNNIAVAKIIDALQTLKCFFTKDCENT
jgi:hypothetical protein